tara:strand:+ start:6257 stop:6409 length:153 start_codon:yes stop_codon:yes gene_type:complete
MDGNGSQAVLRAGYNTKYSDEMAYRLFRIPRINIPLKMLRMPVGRDCKCG